jgi:hypothetical protein
VVNAIRFSLYCSAVAAALPVFPQIATSTMSSELATVVPPPVAHVYVATPKGVDLFDAAADGKLTLNSGSPFEGDFSDIVTNGKYFYGTDGTYVYEDSVAPNGALKRIGTFNPAIHGEEPEQVTSLDLAHTGATLYCNVYVGGEGTIYQAYTISKSNGELVWLGNAGDGSTSRFGVGPLSILGDGKFAFQTQNYLTYFMAGFGIGNNGAFVSGIPEDVFPKANSENLYNPYVITADPSNHLAVAVYQQENPPVGPIVGPTQLAVFSSDSSGMLTTTSNHENMPAVEVAAVSAMNMSPAGDLLAVAGNGPGSIRAKGPAGLQIFHFNGASPIIKYTGLLTTAPIDEVHWDNNNHLFAISKSLGKLYVFTVTPTSVSEATGSPYSIERPQRIVVRPL